jgi:hypothetical protein
VIAEISPARPERVPELPVVLKLGCSDASGLDYYGTDELVREGQLHVTAVVCLRNWDLTKFTFGIMRITERQIIPPRRYVPLLQESMDRIHNAAPINVGELKLKK